MTITIIGKVSHQISYKEWSTALKDAVDISQVSALNITGGKNLLNNFVHEFCKDYNVSLVEWETSETYNSESAKLLRNQQMIRDCDTVVAFMSADDTTIRRSTAHKDVENNSLNKPVVIINLSKSSIPKNISLYASNEHTDFIPEDINKDELITIEEELKLISRAQKGDKDAMAQLIYVNRRFVRSLAKRYQDHGLSLDELISAGNKGIEAACMKYDPSRGFKFISFAVWFVRQSIQALLAKRIIK